MVPRALLAALLFACVDGVTRPVYLVGDASVAVVNESGVDVVTYRTGDSLFTLAPHDSLCRHFWADGNWQTVYVWSPRYTPLVLQWAPAAPVVNVTLRVWDDGHMTDTQAQQC